MPASEISLLLQLLDAGYNRKAWHGPNLRGALRGVTHDQAAFRPAPGRHNIWEIAVHASYWKYSVRRRLLAEPRGSFPLHGSNWFPRPDESHDPAGLWRADLRLLDEMHGLLREAVAGLCPALLHNPVPGPQMTVFSMISGIAMHDVYHAGQIQTLKRLLPERPRQRARRR